MLQNRNLSCILLEEVRRGGIFLSEYADLLMEDSKRKVIINLCVFLPILFSTLSQVDN